MSAVSIYVLMGSYYVMGLVVKWVVDHRFHIVFVFLFKLGKMNEKHRSYSTKLRFLNWRPWLLELPESLSKFHT